MGQRRPRCTTCGSKRWHRDALSGAVVCDEGHLLQGFVQETTDTQEGPSQHTQTSRRMRKNKRKKHRLPSNAHFHGDRNRFLLFQCMQFILREQLRVVIDDLGWPVELEGVARDLWTLLVASSGVKPTPVDAARGHEPADSYSGPRPGSRYNRDGRKQYGPRGVKRPNVKKEDGDAPEEGGPPSAAADGRADNAERGDRAGSHSSSSDSGSDSSSYFSTSGEEADDERPREGSFSRASSPVSAPSSPTIPPQPPEDEAVFNIYTQPFRTPRRAYRPPVVDDPRDAPRMEFTLLVIYLACVTLRLPVFLSDIFRLADTHQIMYLDACRHLPHQMQRHLDKYSKDVLSPKTVPHLYSHNASLRRLREDSVQTWLKRLVVMYRDDWEVEFPEANVPLLLARACDMLALPPAVHALTSHFFTLLPGPYSFSLPTTFHTRLPAFYLPSAPPQKPHHWPRPVGRLRGAQDWRSALPEVKIVSAVVMIARLLWRLDAEDDDEQGANSSVLDVPPRAVWLDAAERLAAIDKSGDVASLWTGDACDMTGDEIDAYLEWFEDRILSAEKTSSRFYDVARFFAAPEVWTEPRPKFGPDAFLDKVEGVLEPLCGAPASPPADEPRHVNGAKSQPLPKCTLPLLPRPFANGFIPLFPPSSSPPPPSYESRHYANGFSSEASSPAPALRAAAFPVGPSSPSTSPSAASEFPASTQETAAPLPSHLPSVLPSYSRTCSLPPGPAALLATPLHRLLTTVAAQLTPVPLALPPSWRGPAPSDESTGAQDLVPFIEQMEHVLAHSTQALPLPLADSSGASGDTDTPEREEAGGCDEVAVARAAERAHAAARERAKEDARAEAAIDELAHAARRDQEDEREGRARRRRRGALEVRAGDPYELEFSSGWDDLSTEEGENGEDGVEGATQTGTESEDSSEEDSSEEEEEEDDDDDVTSEYSSAPPPQTQPRRRMRVYKSAEYISSSDDEDDSSMSAF
ncbi:hypothetical protein JCM3770_003589 [Rhodotorula araucariae]